LGAVDDSDKLESIRDEVREFCAGFPAPGIALD
jgi:hypothetical protein